MGSFPTLWRQRAGSPFPGDVVKRAWGPGVVSPIQILGPAHPHGKDRGHRAKASRSVHGWRGAARKPGGDRSGRIRGSGRGSTTGGERRESDTMDIVEDEVAPSGFEPLSQAPKARMLGHYTTGLSRQV